jgi:hypothetical protein
MSKDTVSGIMRLRQLHLQSIAQIWGEGAQIEEFIKEYGQGGRYKYTNPKKLYPDAFWSKLVVEIGPKNPLQEASASNPYHFWAEGVAPFFNAANGQYMVQPFANNRIYVSVPKKLTEIDGQPVSPSKMTKAIAAYFVSSPGMFGERDVHHQKDLSYNNDSGGKIQGDLDAMEAAFGIDSGFFIKMITRYISPSSFHFNPMQQSLTHALAPKTKAIPSFDLSDNSSLYHSFGAAMQNLLALMWSNDSVRKSVITNPENMDKDGGYVAGGTIQLLKELVNYDYPFLMDLVIVEDTEVEFHKEVWESKSNMGEVKLTNPHSDNYKKMLNRWVWTYKQERIDTVMNSGIEVGKYYLRPKFPLQTLELMVPMQPDMKENSAVALTRYNVDSSGYPFSC